MGALFSMSEVPLYSQADMLGSIEFGAENSLHMVSPAKTETEVGITGVPRS